MSITSESWWIREVIPASLSTLGARLRTFYKLSAGAIGTKGNAAHVYGYHRSANWVRHSAFCTNRTYSQVETPGNRRPANLDWVCALDATLPNDALIAACKRLDRAVRAGRLEKVTEWYGNDDGDNRVDGYDNVRNRVSSSDPSHLWHLHLSFDRGRVGEDHTDVYEILTGDTVPLTDAEIKKIAKAVWDADQIPAPREPNADPDFSTNPTWQADNTLRAIIEQGRIYQKATDAKLDAIIAALAGGPVIPPPGNNTSATFTGKVEFGAAVAEPPPAG